MPEIGMNDVFERKYTQKFRVLASRFGEFVFYERDKAARDIGIHLTKKLGSGKEAPSGPLCWFQLKGIMRASLSKHDLHKMELVKMPLKVDHLRFWFLQLMPTYLGLYVESLDKFLVLNLQKYVADKWGPAILTLDQDEVTVNVPTESVLDKQAFRLILRDSDISTWTRVLKKSKESVGLCLPDYDLIWHLGTASKRKVKHRVQIEDWQTKLRGEMYFEERKVGDTDDWHEIRSHWQFMLRAAGAEEMYPYLEFFPLDEDELAEMGVYDSFWDDAEESPSFELSNGDVIHGQDIAGEVHRYYVGVRLNRLGKRLYESVAHLIRIGMIKVTEGRSGFINIAPWEARSV